MVFRDADVEPISAARTLGDRSAASAFVSPAYAAHRVEAEGPSFGAALAV